MINLLSWIFQDQKFQLLIISFKLIINQHMHYQKLVPATINSQYIQETFFQHEPSQLNSEHQLKQRKVNSSLIQKMNQTVKQISSYQVSQRDSAFLQQVQSVGSSLAYSLKPVYHTNIQQCLNCLSLLKLHNYEEMIIINPLIEQYLRLIKTELNNISFFQKEKDEKQGQHTKIDLIINGQNTTEKIVTERHSVYYIDRSNGKLIDRSNYLERDNQQLKIQINTLNNKIIYLEETNLGLKFELEQNQRKMKELENDNAQLNEQLFDLNQRIVTVDLQVQKKLQQIRHHYEQKEHQIILQNDRKHLENISNIKKQYQNKEELLRKKQQQLKTQYQIKTQDLLLKFQQLQKEKEFLIQKARRLENQEQYLDKRQQKIRIAQQQLSLLKKHTQQKYKIQNDGIRTMQRVNSLRYYSRVLDTHQKQQSHNKNTPYEQKLGLLVSQSRPVIKSKIYMTPQKNSEISIKRLKTQNIFEKSASKNSLKNEKLESLEEKLSKLKTQIRKEINSFSY